MSRPISGNNQSDSNLPRVAASDATSAGGNAACGDNKRCEVADSKLVSVQNAGSVAPDISDPLPPTGSGSPRKLLVLETTSVSVMGPLASSMESMSTITALPVSLA
jgi:hypothetical protein